MNATKSVKEEMLEKKITELVKDIVAASSSKDSLPLRGTEGGEVEKLNDLNRELSHLGEHILSGKAGWEHKFLCPIQLERAGEVIWQPSLKLGAYAEYRSRAYNTLFFTYAWPNCQLPEALRTRHPRPARQLQAIRKDRNRRNRTGHPQLQTGPHVSSYDCI